MSRSPSPVAKTEKKEKDKKNKKEKKKKRRRSDSNSDGEQSDSELNKKKLKKAKKLKKQAKPEKNEPDEENTKSSEPKLVEKKSIKSRLGVVNEMEENQESASEVEQPNEKPLATSKVIQEPAHSPSPSPVTKTDEPEVPEYKVSNKD